MQPGLGASAPWRWCVGGSRLSERTRFRLWDDPRTGLGWRGLQGLSEELVVWSGVIWRDERSEKACVRHSLGM